MTNERYQLLNQIVANCTVMYTKLHHYHWYVTGSDFFTLHEKFESLYDYMHETLDEVAERLLAIGGSPVSTLKDTLQLTRLSEGEQGLNATQMVESVIADFKQFIVELQELMTVSEDEDDQGTSDMALGIKTQLEKEVWLLSAYLK